jgi:pilus assembly protein Flp/PilA
MARDSNARLGRWSLSARAAITGVMNMNGAQYFFARAQHYFTLASEATDAKEKKAFEALATELWPKSPVPRRQDRLVDNLDAATFYRRTVPLLHTSAGHSRRNDRGESQSGGRTMRLVEKFLRDQSGATAIEYGLIAAGISVAIIAVVNSLGSQLKTTFNSITSNLATAGR